MKKFVTAEWRDLVMANYAVDPSLLAARVPSGTEIDLFEGKCYVSLVGFMFLDTRVMGFLVPFHVNFEEVNLRFYIKRNVDGEERRAVCFVKEIVPKAAIAAVARVMYGEPYECWQMDHTQSRELIEYEWHRGGVQNRISVRPGNDLGVPAQGSHGEFIIEHYWGYTDRGNGRVDEYKVEHPKWELFDTESSTIGVDFGRTYGEEFAFLDDETPESILIAKGSPITVYKGAQLK